MSKQTIRTVLFSTSAGSAVALVAGVMAYGLFGFAPYHDADSVAAMLVIVAFVTLVAGTCPAFED